MMEKTVRWLAPAVLIGLALTAAGCTQTCRQVRANLPAHSAYAALCCEKRFSTFTKALNRAGLARTFQMAGAYTIFVPTNKAFARLPKGMLAALERKRNRPELRDLLWNHILIYHLTPAGAVNQPRRFMANQSRTVIASDGKVLLMIGHAKIVSGPLRTRNATIYAINRVLLPSGRGY